MRIQMAMRPKIFTCTYNAGKSGKGEKFKEEFRKKVSVNGLLRGFGRLVTRMAWKISAV